MKKLSSVVLCFFFSIAYGWFIPDFVSSPWFGIMAAFLGGLGIAEIFIKLENWGVL